MLQFAQPVEMHDGEPTQALIATLKQIRERAKSQFQNPLEVGYYRRIESRPQVWLPEDCPRFCIAEIVKEDHRLTAIIVRKGEPNIGIPGREYRPLLFINTWFSRKRKKLVIEYKVLDPSITEIVKKEMDAYSKLFGATAVNLSH